MHAPHYLTMLVVASALCPSWLAAQNDAASLFKSMCGPSAENGSGNSPAGKALKAKDLRSLEIQSKSDNQTAQVITKGQNKMPAFGE